MSPIPNSEGRELMCSNIPHFLDFIDTPVAKNRVAHIHADFRRASSTHNVRLPARSGSTAPNRRTIHILLQIYP